jgi:tRNA(Arg) A34 adenosine deaminase TadA
VRWRELVDAVTQADEVEASKPNPDIVQGAVAKLGLGAGECALIGDTPWDCLSATRAGVVAVGVASGANEPRALLRCGARMAYADVADVLGQLDRVLQLASPSRVRLAPEFLADLMRDALKEATVSLDRGEMPVGAVVTNGAGKILGRGRSRWRETGNPLAHAELEALLAARGGLDSLARDGILVTTLEPGPMVAAAAIEASLDTIVFAVPAPAEAGARRVAPSETGQRQVCRLVGNVLEAESRRLFQRWVFRADRGQEHDPYVDALLGSGPG